MGPGSRGVAWLALAAAAVLLLGVAAGRPSAPPCPSHPRSGRQKQGACPPASGCCRYLLTPHSSFWLRIFDRSCLACPHCSTPLCAGTPLLVTSLARIPGGEVLRSRCCLSHPLRSSAADEPPSSVGVDVLGSVLKAAVQQQRGRRLLTGDKGGDHEKKDDRQDGRGEVRGAATASGASDASGPGRRLSLPSLIVAHASQPGSRAATSPFQKLQAEPRSSGLFSFCWRWPLWRS
jgi:hypothetical protein